MDVFYFQTFEMLKISDRPVLRVYRGTTSILKKIRAWFSEGQNNA